MKNVMCILVGFVVFFSFSFASASTQEEGVWQCNEKGEVRFVPISKEGSYIEPVVLNRACNNKGVEIPLNDKVLSTERTSFFYHSTTKEFVVCDGEKVDTVTKVIVDQFSWFIPIVWLSMIMMVLSIVIKFRSIDDSGVVLSALASFVTFFVSMVAVHFLEGFGLGVIVFFGGAYILGALFAFLAFLVKNPRSYWYPVVMFFIAAVGVQLAEYVF